MKFANGAELAAMTDDETLLPSTPYEVPEDLGAFTYFEAQCAPLHDILTAKVPGAIEAMGLGTRPVIDLLSVDAEGTEIEIFKDFPFEAWDIRVVVVETSRRTSMAIDGLFLTNGFFKIAVLGKDAVYLHRSVMASLPTDGLTFPD